MAPTLETASHDTGGTTGLRPLKLALLAALALGGSYFAFVSALAGVTQNKAPQVALSVDGDNAAALASIASAMTLASPGRPSAKALELARRSIRAEALNPVALRVFGYALGSGAQDAGRARVAMLLAESLSRRDGPTQLWLIENEAKRGSLTAALGHVDTLLRSKPDAGASLYPILIRGLPDPAFRKRLAGQFGRPSPWLSEFLSFAIQNSANPADLVPLYVEAGRLPAFPAAMAHAQNLLERLARANRFDLVRTIYLLMPGSDPIRLQSTAFTPADKTGKYGVAGWFVMDRADAGAEFIGAAAPEMAAFVDPEVTRTVATKLLFLAPGTYCVTADMEQFDGNPDSRLDVSVRCPQGAAQSQAARYPVKPGSAPALIVLPADCRVQYLDVIMSGGRGQSGLDARIKSITLSRQ